MKTFDCLFCHNKDAPSNVSDSVRGDASGQIRVATCSSCGLTQQSPAGYSLDIYEKDSQVYSSINECGTSFDQYIKDMWLEAERRVTRVLADYKIITHEGMPRNTLDIGGGYGFFGCLLKNNAPNAKVVILDPSAQRVETGHNLIREHYISLDKSIPNTTSIQACLDEHFLESQPLRYDLVTMWHVLEHMPDPIGFLNHAYSLVEPGGLLSIEVPNSEDELLKLSPAFQNYSYMIEHLSYFSPTMLQKIAKRIAPASQAHIKGFQRYGMFNYMHWIYKNSPPGEKPDYFSGADRWWLERSWRLHREEHLTTDALVLNIRKPEIQA